MSPFTSAAACPPQPPPPLQLQAGGGGDQPKPQADMKTTQRDNTAKPHVEPRIQDPKKSDGLRYSKANDGEEIPLRSTPTGPPNREAWKKRFSKGSQTYFSATRGTRWYYICEEPLNPTQNVYHYLSDENPDQWRQFWPKDYDFNGDLQETITAMMPALDLAAIIVEESAWGLAGEAYGLVGKALSATERAAGKVSREAAGRMAAELTEKAAQKTAQELRALMLAKVGGNAAKAINWTDDELASFVKYSQGIGLGKDDIVALLSMKVRRDDVTKWALDLSTMKKVGLSLVQKAANHQIAFKKGKDFMGVYREAQEKMLNGGELDPSSYLDDAYIQQHLKQFEGEGSYLVSGTTFDSRINGKPKIGRTEGLFISTKDEIDRALKTAKGDTRELERLLGFDDGWLTNKQGVYRVDVKAPEKRNLRIPNGSEEGSNEFWTPGGYTAGGTKEAMIEQTANNQEIVRTDKVID